MKPITLILAVFLGHSCLCLAADEEARVWTSRVGTKTKASLVEVDGKVVRLKLQSGKTVNVAIDDLSKEDQDFLRKNEPATGRAELKSPESGKEPSGKEPPQEPAPGQPAKRLPLIDAVKIPNIYALYEGKYYSARVNSGGGIQIKLKEVPEAAAEWAITILPETIVQRPAGREHYKMGSFLEWDPPNANATKVRYLGKFAKGTEMEVIYEFTPDTISTWCGVKAGFTGPEGTVHRMCYLLSHLPAVGVDLSKQRIDQTRLDSKRVKLNFNDMVSFRGDSKKIKISGTFWGDREITFERARADLQSMRPYQYPNTSLSGGFAIYGALTVSTTKNIDNEKLTISFK